jgi:hypothetical protein
MSSKAWQEETSVVNSLDESVNSVSISLDTRDNDSPVLVLKSLRSSYSFGASFDSLLVDSSGIVDCEGHILDSVSVLLKLLGELLIARVKRRLESEDNFSISDNMGAVVSAASLKALNDKNYVNT